MSFVNKKQGELVLELGGGDNPISDSDVRVDIRATQHTHFTCDLNKPEWPEISSSEFDVVVSRFCLEHISFRNTLNFLKECYRILKSGGRLVLTLPNTEAQLRWIVEHPDGWDGKNFFTSASELLFGSQDYSENAHCAYFNAAAVNDLCKSAGFVSVEIQVYGERATDLKVIAFKAANPKIDDLPKEQTHTVQHDVNKHIHSRAELFDRHYFTGGGKVGGYAREGIWDFPCHWITHQHILSRKPESVLEIGCLIEGSPIVTSDGVKPIESLEEGMEVYTHEGQFSKISRMSYRPYSGDVICIDPRYSRGMTLKLTPDHPVFAVEISRKFKSWKPEITSSPMWVPAGELSRDRHWLAIPRPKKTLDIDIDPDYARLCGYYLADGWCQKKFNGRSTGYTVSFCYRHEKQAYADDVRNLMKRFFGTTDGWTEDDGEKAFKICFYSKTGFAQLGSVLGRGARNKNIPAEWINGASDEALKQLVLGMYRGDGTVPKNDRMSYKTTSVSLATSLRLVLLRLGVVTEIGRCEPRTSQIQGRVIVGGESYDVRSSGVHYDGFATIVGYPPRQRTDGRAYWFGRMDDDFVYVPIKRLNQESYTGFVYNMDVEEDHSYSHPVCTVHNCARGYQVKRLQDVGTHANGLEISRHCWLTRVCDGIIEFDICDDSRPWPYKDKFFDLCFSLALLEHIPEECLPWVFSEMKRVSKQAFHGIDFGEKDDGFDKTHCTLREPNWWIERINSLIGSDYHVEIANKEDLEKGVIPEHIMRGDGKAKLHLGCGPFTMLHNGWMNIDVCDAVQFAQHYGYHFMRHDLRNGVPVNGSETVDMVAMFHTLEHFTYEEGLRLLKDIRRVIKPNGVMRISVPDADLLTNDFGNNPNLNDTLDELGEGVAKASTNAKKLYELLMAGHSAIYDWETLSEQLKEAGFHPVLSSFRNDEGEINVGQLIKETFEMDYELSLFVNAYPITS